MATCDVDKMRVDNSMNTLAGRQAGAKVEGYEEYRRILDRNDVDAVLIGTPDHWHSQMVIDAISAGKDVYCEKPVSNTVEAAVRMRDAARKSNRIIQIGTQQRSWGHFQEAAKLFHEGYIGTAIRHVVMYPPGGGGGGGAAPRQRYRRLRHRCRPSRFRKASTGTSSRDRRRGSRSSASGAVGAAGTRTAVGTSRTGACTSWTSWPGS